MPGHSTGDRILSKNFYELDRHNLIAQQWCKYDHLTYIAYVNLHSASDSISHLLSTWTHLLLDNDYGQDNRKGHDVEPYSMS